MRLVLPIVFFVLFLTSTFFLVELKALTGVFAVEEKATAGKVRMAGLLVNGPETKCQASQTVLCFKLFPNDGGRPVWVRYDNLQMFSGRRVEIVGVPKRYNATDYLELKKISAFLDKSLVLGIGGGYDYIGNPNIEGNGNGYWYTPAQLGIKTLNPGLYWSTLQPTIEHAQQGTTTNQGWPDGSMLWCKENGVQCVIYIDGFPEWSGRTNLALVPPDKREQCVDRSMDAPNVVLKYPYRVDQDKLELFKKFGQLVAERYDGDGVDDASGSPVAHSIEFLNELDIKTSANCGNLSPTEYADMLGSFYDGVKLASNDMKVSFQRLATTGSDQSKDWITAVLNNPNGQKFDYMNVHYYPNFDSRWPSFEGHQVGLQSMLAWINKKMLLSVGEVRPIIISELGSFSGVTEPAQLDQANWLFRSIAWALSHYNVDLIQWYTIRDACGTNSDGTLSCAGLLRGEYFIKSRAYWAFRAVSKELQGLKFLTTDKSDPSRLEGYIFTDGKDVRKEILWAKAPSATRRFNTSSLTLVNTDSYSPSKHTINVRDGVAPDIDNIVGKITLNISDPVIVDVSKDDSNL